MTRRPEQDRRKEARQSARFVREKLNLGDKDFDVGVVMGAGWTQPPSFDKEYDAIAVRKIPGFEHWEERDDKDKGRMLWSGKIGEKRTVVLPEGVQLNYDMDYPASTRHLVRLQVEFLCQLGARTVIVTGTAAPLKDLSDGDIAVVRSFVSLFAPPRPLYGGETVNPGAALDPALRRLALEKGSGKEPRVREACYVVVPGPDVESDEDRVLMALCGGQVVGTHGLPEAAVAAVNDVKMLMLAVVASRQAAAAKESPAKQAKRLASYLGAVIGGLP